MTIVHFIWLLAPLLFLWLIVWGSVRRMFKKIREHEHIAEYAQGLLFTSVCFIIAVMLDKSDWWGNLFNRFFESWVSYDFVRFFTFPVVMLILAYLQKLILGEKREVLRGEHIMKKR